MSLERKTVLLHIANERLRDANVLLKQKRYNGAVYLGGYVIECMLKAAICVYLSRNDLPAIYQIHDLDELMDSSGLLPSLQIDRKMSSHFLTIEGWCVGIRYLGKRFKASEAKHFLDAVKEIRQWILTKISP
ncbi:HEPN domain-containing protein [Candidatus Poribacteria bacterium]|nr:HEPN domain-containing protein [Candidatus Poribacteria bacterium]